jgi:hypothetical protein
MPQRSRLTGNARSAACGEAWGGGKGFCNAVAELPRPTADGTESRILAQKFHRGLMPNRPCLLHPMTLPPRASVADMGLG